MTKARIEIPASATTVIVDLSHAHEMRFAAFKAFEELARELTQRGVDLRLAGVPLSFCAFVSRVKSSLKVTPAELEPGASVRRCLSRVPRGERPSGAIRRNTGS